MTGCYIHVIMNPNHTNHVRVFGLPGLKTVKGYSRRHLWVGNALYVCFSFIAEDGRSHIFRKIFDIKEKVWRDDVMAVLEYNGKTYDFSDESLNIIYCDKGLAPRAKVTDLFSYNTCHIRR